MLKQGIELNKPIKIGWSREGEPIPKKGEMGLAPGLPKNGRIRILGELGSMNAILCQGGAFSLEGSAKDFHAAWNNGGTHIVERKVGENLGHGMVAGKIIARDGCDKFAGSSMEGGLLIIRGNAGPHLGAGMKGGTILVTGDVGNSVGTRMTGGRILVSGRCPKPGEGAQITALSEHEIDEFNKNLDDDLLNISKDIICIISDKSVDKSSTKPVKKYTGNWDDITIVPDINSRKLVEGQELDTLLIIGGENIEGMDDTVETIGLEQPFIIKSNKSIKSLTSIVSSKPSEKDLLLINSDNINLIHNHIFNCAGIVIDLSSLPNMNSESLDGLLISLRALSKRLIPILIKDGLNRVNNLHYLGKNHFVQGVIVNLEDFSGLHAASSLPKIGRSIIESKIDRSACPTFLQVPWQASAKDIIIAKGCGIDAIISTMENNTIEDLNLMNRELRGWLEELGIDSIEKVERKHLRANSYESSTMSGIRLAGFERALPMWFSQ
ncbi:MAG: hypothetical protein CMB56_000775 [Methanobacteriota archaeon]|nr:MAG: hypothetical protein CMB56_000775 [Euryarchaeota archaeon]